MTIRNNLEHYYSHVAGDILEDDPPRNMITLDQFFGYIISRGVPVNFSVGTHDNDVPTETRTWATLILKMPNRDAPGYGSEIVRTRQPSYTNRPFSSVGLTLGHALQGILDQLEREV